ncbi:hypothetical protein PR048_002258 [Dryococelus australis]|uniref:Uncharacterized protein n=1 Tax=Dryococelus australis TaxID=614101 RepID=A0ABQ9IJP5_9NEOP|nr:hypothetical protein PR048_002258 [Dryococelus australis]
MGSQDLGVKSRPNLFTRSLSIPPTRTYFAQKEKTLRTTQARASHASSSLCARATMSGADSSASCKQWEPHTARRTMIRLNGGNHLTACSFCLGTKHALYKKTSSALMVLKRGIDGSATEKRVPGVPRHYPPVNSNIRHVSYTRKYGFDPALSRSEMHAAEKLTLHLTSLSLGYSIYGQTCVRNLGPPPLHVLDSLTCSASSDVHRRLPATVVNTKSAPGKQWHPSFIEEGLHIPRHMRPGIILLKYGMWSCLKEGYPQYVGVEIACCIQWRLKLSHLSFVHYAAPQCRLPDGDYDSDAMVCKPSICRVKTDPNSGDVGRYLSCVCRETNFTVPTKCPLQTSKEDGPTARLHLQLQGKTPSCREAASPTVMVGLPHSIVEGCLSSTLLNQRFVPLASRVGEASQLASAPWGASRYMLRTPSTVKKKRETAPATPSTLCGSMEKYNQAASRSGQRCGRPEALLPADEAGATRQLRRMFEDSKIDRSKDVSTNDGDEEVIRHKLYDEPGRKDGPVKEDFGVFNFARRTMRCLVFGEPILREECYWLRILARFRFYNHLRCSGAQRTSSLSITRRCAVRAQGKAGIMKTTALHAVASKGPEPYMFTASDILVRIVVCRRTGFDSLHGHSRIFACRNPTGRCLRAKRFLGDLPFPPTVKSCIAPYSPCFALGGSQDLYVKSRSSLTTPLYWHTPVAALVELLSPHRDFTCNVISIVRLATRGCHDCHLTPSLVVRLHEAGWSARRISIKFGRAITMVTLCVQAWICTGFSSRRVDTRLARPTTDKAGHRIRRCAVTESGTTSREILKSYAINVARNIKIIQQMRCVLRCVLTCANFVTGSTSGLRPERSALDHSAILTHTHSLFYTADDTPLSQIASVFRSRTDQVTGREVKIS